MTNPDNAQLAPEAATTMPAFIRAIARAYGDDIAVTLTVPDQPEDSMTFAALERHSAELARGLIASGVGKGSRIGFIYGNGPDFAAVFAAIARIGGVAVPISTMIRANELVRVLRQSDVSGLLVQRSVLGHDLAARLVDALPELAAATGPDLRIAKVPFLRWIVCSGPDLPNSFHGFDRLTDAAASVSEELLIEVESEVHAADQMLEIYTSGSMALPKGVRHLHGAVLFRGDYIRRMIGRKRHDESQVPLPMFWVGGMMMYLMPNLMAGAVTHCFEGSLMSSQMAMGSVLAADDLAKLTMNKPYWALGMSETLGPYSYGDELRAPGFPLCTPIDHIAERYEVRLADDQDRPVAPGETGEVQVRGYALAPGLHKVEREVYYTADGYYRTGDLAFADGDRINFIGRDGDMIKTAGSNVSPAEVEMELQQVDGVHSAYVFGLKDAERGQKVVAALVPRDGATLDFAAIEAQMRGKLSSYKVPRAYLTLTREEVPVLHSNKVGRRQLAALVEERLG